jgi:hypothetical protein
MKIVVCLSRLVIPARTAVTVPGLLSITHIIRDLPGNSDTPAFYVPEMITYISVKILLFIYQIWQNARIGLMNTL